MAPSSNGVSNGTLDPREVLAWQCRRVLIHRNRRPMLPVSDVMIPPLSLFAKVVRLMSPRGGRMLLLVRYAGQLLGTGEVSVVVG